MSALRLPAHVAEFGANSSFAAATLTVPVMLTTANASDRYSKSDIVPLSPLYLKKKSVTYPNGAEFFGSNPYLRAATAYASGTPLLPYILLPATAIPTPASTTPTYIVDDRIIASGDDPAVDNATLYNILAANDDLEYVKIDAVLEVQATSQDVAKLEVYVKPEVGIWLNGAVGTVMQKGGKYVSENGLIKVETSSSGTQAIQSNKAFIQLHLKVNDVPKDGAVLFGAAIYGVNIVNPAGPTSATDVVVKIRSVNISAKKKKAL